MNILHLIGRILFGALFLVNGVNHFLRTDMLSQYAASKGVPLPTAAVLITGIMMLVAAVTVILGYKPRIGLWLVVIFLVPVALIMHNFWALPAEQQAAQMPHFLKNMALAGGALMLIAVADRPWPYSLGGASAGAGAPGASPGGSVGGVPSAGGSQGGSAGSPGAGGPDVA